MESYSRNEIKNLGHGNLDGYDEEEHNWPDYHSELRGWNWTVLANQNLVVNRWYAFGGYTSIEIESLRGNDDWKVESDMVTFQWRIPQD